MSRPAMFRERAVAQTDDPAEKHYPIFRNIFGKSWEMLPPVMRRHYANRPYSADQVTVKGHMDVMSRGPIRLLRPLLQLLGLIPPYNATNVPVTVSYASSKDSREFRLNRTFNFSNGKPYRFQSRMLRISGNEVVEIMCFGIGWRMNYLWQNNRVILKHRGYLLNIFSIFIPLPLTALLGTTHAEEVAVDENTFDMFVESRHPWWGKIYSYSGRFRLSGDA